ncbi:hypothetical protein ACIQKB_36800 [Streptomyces sp. NPDC092046]|uniref:hypothetical protein n=1 Tax=Streptomyces sp. NPDC092046 TaxID=3366009 RepID=UPI003815B96B
MTINHAPVPRPDAEPGHPVVAEGEFVQFGRFAAGRRSLPEPPPYPEDERRLVEGAVQERAVLAEAAAAGQRAAEWMRALPLPPSSWVRGVLADAVEEAMGTLDPADEDGVDGYGQGGVRDSVQETLDGLIYCLADTSPHLTPQQQAALLAVVACVRGIPRLLANHGWSVVHGGGLTGLCKVIDSAITSL